MNNFDKRFEPFRLKHDFNQLCIHIVGKSKDIALYINRYYDVIADAIKLYDMQEELLKRKTNRIIRLKQELYKSNKECNKYYSALKKINEICAKNSCTANPEYLSDLLYDIERNVVDALSDDPKACKAKD
jgi:hypothetical protein